MGFLQGQQFRLDTPVLEVFLYAGRHAHLVWRASLHTVLGRVVVDVEIQRNFAHRALAAGQQLDHHLFDKYLVIFSFHDRRCFKNSIF